MCSVCMRDEHQDILQTPKAVTEMLFEPAPNWKFMKRGGDSSEPLGSGGDW